MSIERQFIEQSSFVQWFDAQSVIFHCQFNYTHYDDSWYQRLNINFSDRLTRAVVKRKAEFLAGRYCANEALKKYDIRQYTVGIGDSREPLWPSKVFGSISHCDSNAVATIGAKYNIAGVGIDIEKYIPFDTASRLKKYILDLNEQALLLNGVGELTASKNFTIAFSMKESFYKAAFHHVNKVFDFDAVSIVEIDHLQQSLLFCINYTLADKLPKGNMITGHYHFLPNNVIVTLVEF